MTTLIIPTERQKPSALFLRMAIGNAEMPDGRPVELWMSGATLGIEVGTFDTERIVETIHLGKLGAIWMRAIDDGVPTEDEIVEQLASEQKLAERAYGDITESDVEDAIRAAVRLARGEQR